MTQSLKNRQAFYAKAILRYKKILQIMHPFKTDVNE